jgi:hypothetical protein
MIAATFKAELLKRQRARAEKIAEPIAQLAGLAVAVLRTPRIWFKIPRLTRWYKMKTRIEEDIRRKRLMWN